jgi:ribosome-binding factor A
MIIRSLFRQPFLARLSRREFTSLPINYQQQYYPSQFTLCTRSFSSAVGPNPGLASVVAQGIKALEDTAGDVEARTRHISIEPKSNQPTHRQLAEAQRILEAATDCLDDLCMKHFHQQQQQQVSNNLPGLHLQGQPIVLLDVHVNKDVKLAKVYWTLPYSVFLDPNVTQRVYQKLVEVLQEQLIQQGGAKILAREVGSKLRFYYPPRIKLVPATDEMIQQAVAEFHEL